MTSKNPLRFALVLAAAASLAPAGLAAETKVGVFNPNRALVESPQGKAVIGKLNAERDEKTRELVTEQKDLRALEERLNRDGAIMSEQERADVESRYRTKRQRIERRVAEIDEDLNARRQEELSRIERLIISEARAYSKEAGFDIVLGPGVVYAKAEVDITDAVVKRLTALAATAAPRAAEPAKPAPATKK